MDFLLTRYFSNSSKKRRRVVIFAQGRTGSTLLEDLLCSTGYFEENGELLHERFGKPEDPYTYITEKSNHDAKINFLFRLKIYQLTLHRKNIVDPARLLNKFQQDGWYIIYLKRKNKIKQLLSYAVAEHRQSYHKMSDDPLHIRLKLDPQRFMDTIFGGLFFEKQEEEALKNLQFLPIVYEDDLESHTNHQATVDKILDYLDLQHKPAKTKHFKVMTQSTQDVIENYDEIYEKLKENDWHILLD